MTEYFDWGRDKFLFLIITIMRKFFLIFSILSLVMFSGCSFLERLGIGRKEGSQAVKPGAMKIADIPAEDTTTAEGERVPVRTIAAILKTNLGDIKVSFFPTDAPRTIMNFANLAKADFYDGTKFHRVIKGFMIQAGDPNSKDDDKSDDGSGGPGYTFADEINPRTLEGLGEEDIKKLEDGGYVYNYDLPASHNIVRGVIAMANSGPNTNGSQFFIMVGESAEWLDGRHTVFGQVVEGMDIVDKINLVEVGENDYPVEDVVLEDVIILVNEGLEASEAMEGSEAVKPEGKESQEGEADSTEEAPVVSETAGEDTKGDEGIKGSEEEE